MERRLDAEWAAHRATALKLEQVEAQLQAEKTAHAEVRQALQAEVAGHHQTRDRLDRLRAELTAEALSHAESRRMLQDEVAGNSDLRAHLPLLRAELQALRGEKLQVLERLRAVETDLSTLQRSRSWRVTAPLRSVVRTLRALRTARDDSPGTASAPASAMDVDAPLERQPRQVRRVQRDLGLAVTRIRDR
jgi:chromosome segregation ATPase